MTSPNPTPPRLDIKVGDWVVTEPAGYGGLLGPVESVTDKMFRARRAGFASTCLWTKRKSEALFVGAGDQARALHNKLKSMQGDFERRQREAEQRHREAMDRACKEAQDGQ